MSATGERARAAALRADVYWWCRSCTSAWSYAVGSDATRPMCPGCGAIVKPLRPFRQRNVRAQRPGLLQDGARALRLQRFTDSGAGYPLGVGMPMGTSVSWVKALKRDPCAYCGERATSIDHIVPIDERVPAPPFGKSGWLNYAGACQRCNSEKGSTSLLRFLLERLGSDDRSGDGPGG